MAALSFVMDHTTEFVQDEESRQILLEDSRVVESSLNYINDLLRSMLDINRAKCGRLRVSNSPTDILHDVLEPAAAILCIRGTSVEVTIDCPEDLIVETDQLRLKQVCLNLVNNASKFTKDGFIRLRALSTTNNVVLFVEDSGPSVPEQKRECLFDSFQDSLDPLNQGMGIGLSICFNLCQLLGAKIWLDTSYHSGIESCPGSRFVVELQKSPIYIESIIGDISTNLSVGTEHMPQEFEKLSVSLDRGQHARRTLKSPVVEVQTEFSMRSLPANVQVLFVDDETLLRKLFIKMAKKVAPTWTVTEASSGESVLQIVKDKKFDLILIDHYLRGAFAQFLGSEIVRKLRRQGIKSVICGISKNQVGAEFL
jgi:CheY-like chemotaxis protein